ncbi:MAG: DSD1 family PLP-dependent enzyme [Hyphomonadaceae bacterium]
MDDRDLHAHLINQQGSRKSLNTPVLLIDLDAFERNVASMAAFAQANGLRLRPHAKTHKCAEIARRQVAAGAVGVCCAKLGEAEEMAAGGIASILITSPVVSPQAIQRLIKLNDQIADLQVAIDNPANAAALGAATTGTPLKVLIDIDPGIRRTGVASADAAVALAQAIKTQPSLVFTGVQYYCGRQQHIESYAERRMEIVDRTDYLRTIIAALTEAGFPPAIISGGGTGTHKIDVELGLLNELQTGSYIFMDRQYNECDITGEGTPGYDTSLLIDARVVSANTPGLGTIDAGFKAMATDGGPPTVLSGAPAGAAFHFMGDEHGLVLFGDASPPIGAIVTLAVPHCDPTVNLYDFYHVVRGDTLVDLWRIEGRGRSR